MSRCSLSGGSLPGGPLGFCPISQMVQPASWEEHGTPEVGGLSRKGGAISMGGNCSPGLHSSRQPAGCGWSPFQHLPSLTATFLGCWGQPMGPGLGLRQSLHRPAERRAASAVPFSFCSPKLRGSSGATVLGLAPSSPTMGAAVVTPTYPPIHFLLPPLGRNSHAGSGDAPCIAGKSGGKQPTTILTGSSDGRLQHRWWPRLPEANRKRSEAKAQR